MKPYHLRKKNFEFSKVIPGKCSKVLILLRFINVKGGLSHEGLNRIISCLQVAVLVDRSEWTEVFFNIVLTYSVLDLNEVCLPAC